MRFLNKYCLILILALIPKMFSSCDSSEICRENTETPLRVGFYNKDDFSATAIVDSITVYGLGREDSLIYDNAKNVTRVELPLNNAKDTTSFVLIFPQNQDTITIIYSRKITLLSVGCGFTTFYTLSKAQSTKNEIFNSDIQNSNVINDLNEHIKVYITVPTPDK
ncbi:MAG: hypothetical protein KGZ97_08265 [Bacteroidetes bacterium]|nr:hypothetical protein [Bacteroidota bacterium]